MHTIDIPLFVGFPVEDPSERALIGRLRSDLTRLGVRATLYANFYPPARRSCQVDLLVRTDSHTAHIEIKGLRPDYPVRAGVNGLWVQIVPGGAQRPLETNCGRQALEGTFAISDAMRDLARRGVVTEAEDGFKRHIDSIVGMWETIPDGSDIKPPRHVTVLGYAELLQRLAVRGQVVSWTDDEWDAFARSLDLYQPVAESESERRRRSGLEIITDYRLRARSDLAEGVGRFVDVGTTDGDEVEMSAADICRRVVGGAVLAVVGPSGHGKTFLAQHLAVRHCDDGRMVVWIRADGYDKGRFKDLLARAMAPFGSQRWKTLVDAAAESGTALTVVLDGLNECPNDARSELLQQLRAFKLRHPASVLITSTTDEGLRNTLGAEILRVGEPGERTRLEILDSYGARHPERISEQFRTPYELSIAAECESQLDKNASVTELHAAYIRRLAPTEQIRAGLRSLASRMHSQLRTSLPQHQATQILYSSTQGIEPHQVEQVLGCDLLAIDGHRVRFCHELIGQFLAAEDTVHSADSGQSLGLLLSAPANTVLTDTALRLESDHHRAWEALRALSDPGLISSALAGGYGPDVAETAAQAIQDVLARAIAATATATTMLTLDSESGFFGRWVAERGWTEYEHALLAAAGRGLTRGLFIDEVCELTNRTDELCLAQAQRLSADGHQTPASSVFAATYSQSAAPTDGHGLAASYVVTAFEMATMGKRFDSDSRPAGLSRRFAANASARSWGRLYLALLSTDPDDGLDRALFASLLRRAWDAGGYHLQLKALSVAKFFGQCDEPFRSEILDVVRTLNPRHLFLQGSLVELLACFGEINNSTTVEQLRAHIRTTISRPDDIERCRLAYSIVSDQFEDEDIVGPYSAAVDGLTTNEKAWLYTMAARGAEPSHSMHLSWTLDQLVELVPTGDSAVDNAAKAVFADFLSDGPIEDAVIVNEAATPCLTAVRGWAKFEAALPPATGAPTPAQRNWHLVANLLLCSERDDAVVDSEETWRVLLLEPQQTIVTLASLDAARSTRAPDFGHLVAEYPKPLRQLFEWALDNPTKMPVDRLHRWARTDHFVIRMLGAVGDESTAARLGVHTHDPEAGGTVVDAIRKIYGRATP